MRELIGRPCEYRRTDQNGNIYYKCTGHYFLFHFEWCNQLNIRCSTCMNKPDSTKGPISHALVASGLKGIGVVTIPTRDALDAIKQQASKEISQAYYEQQNELLLFGEEN